MTEATTTRTLDQLIESCVGCGWEYSLEPAGEWVLKGGKRFHSGTHRAQLEDESGIEVTAYGATPNDALLRAMAGILAALNHGSET